MKTRTLKIASIVAVVIATMMFTVMPAAAQEGAPNTITVTGNGTALGAPDIANITIGVEVFNPDLNAAFTESNTRIDAIINAVLEAGVAREDVRTSNLNIFLDRFGGPAPMPVDPASSGMAQPEPQATFTVANQVRITVRDVDNVANVINAAVAAGANNIFGLDYSIQDRDALESEARAAAVADARARAEELAELTGVTIGDVVSIREVGSGIGPMRDFAEASMQADGGAVLEPGTLAISSTVTITYAIDG